MRVKEPYVRQTLSGIDGTGEYPRGKMAWGNTHRAWAKIETFLALHQLFTAPAPLVGCGDTTDEKRHAMQPEQNGAVRSLQGLLQQPTISSV